MVDLLNKFEHHLLDNLPKYNSFHPEFNNALSHILMAKAKRFRPMLMLMVVDALEPLLVDNSLDIALGIEMFHTYSLIHDDLKAMDDADTRRFIATTHIKYDEAMAILVGDALNTHTFNLISNSSISDSSKIEIISMLSYCGGIGGMVTGQAIDLYFENKKLSIDEVKFLHIHKTAKLIASSLKAGAIICGCSDKIKNNLYDFGINIGLLFQIQDDILDKTLSSDSAGKDTNNDDNKNSFVNLLGLEESNNEAKKIYTKLNSSISLFDNPIKSILSNLLNKYITII